MPSNHALYHLPCREEDSVSLCPTSLTVLQHQVTVRSFQQNLFNNSSLGLENWDPHVTHNEGAYDTNLQQSAQIIIGCWRVMNLNDLTWVGREKLRLGLESLLRRFTLVPLSLMLCLFAFILLEKKIHIQTWVLLLCFMHVNLPQQRCS